VTDKEGLFTGTLIPARMAEAASLAAVAEAAERFFEASPPLERQQETERALDDFLVTAFPLNLTATPLMESPPPLPLLSTRDSLCLPCSESLAGVINSTSTPVLTHRHPVSMSS